MQPLPHWGGRTSCSWACSRAPGEEGTVRADAPPCPWRLARQHSGCPPVCSGITLRAGHWACVSPACAWPHSSSCGVRALRHCRAAASGGGPGPCLAPGWFLTRGSHPGACGSSGLRAGRAACAEEHGADGCQLLPGEALAAGSWPAVTSAEQTSALGLWSLGVSLTCWAGGFATPCPGQPCRPREGPEPCGA